MGLFGSKEPVQCDICGGTTGTPENKKHKTIDGVICNNCYLAAGFPALGGCFGYQTQMIKEQLESNDGITIFERFKNAANGALERQKAQEAEDTAAVKCSRCGSTQISADKKGFGIGKGVIGAAVAGPIGLVAGNAGAKKVRITCLKCGYQWMAGQG